ncbi:MAG: FAD-binding oxidoreductase [Thermoproteota archaeon]
MYEAVVVGGGSTGVSVLFHLASKGARKILLVERSCLGCGQTGYSSAIIRTQYSHPETRKMAVYGWRFFRERFREETGCEEGAFYETGVAYGAGLDDAEPLRETASALRSEGIVVELMEPEEFAEKIHPVDTRGLALVSWEPHGGYGDPHTYVSCTARAAEEMGAELAVGRRVVGLELRGGSVVGVRLDTGEVVRAQTVVLAANVWTNELLEKHGESLPIAAAREDVVVFSHSGHVAGPVWADMVLGFYSRREGAESTLVGGLEPEPVAEPGSLEPGHYRSPPADVVVKRGVAAERFRYLATARPRAAWYGFYDVTPDWQPILGEHPRIGGLVLAVGLSGHGFKLAPALGDVVSDIVLSGKPRLVDAKIYSLERFEEGRREESRFRHPILS